MSQGCIFLQFFLYLNLVFFSLLVQFLLLVAVIVSFFPLFLQEVRFYWRLLALIQLRPQHQPVPLVPHRRERGVYSPNLKYHSTLQNMPRPRQTRPHTEKKRTQQNTSHPKRTQIHMSKPAVTAISVPASIVSAAEPGNQHKRTASQVCDGSLCILKLNEQIKERFCWYPRTS